jgi:acyl carrier protein
MSADITARLLRCFALVLPELSPEQLRQAAVDSVPTWDSLATATLVTLIEEEFDVKVDPDDLDELISFELIHDYLQRKGKPHDS